MTRANVIVATNHNEAEYVKNEFPQYHFHVVLTPDDTLSGFMVEEYVWTPAAKRLPASTRLRLRGLIAPLIDERSREEKFDETLLSW
jgi:hypothetical protein